jgi:hypothetical protein
LTSSSQPPQNPPPATPPLLPSEPVRLPNGS